MGLGSTTSTILLQFKADTKQARSEIKKLKGEQKKAAQESLSAMEKQNKGIERQIAVLGKLALGVGTAVAAYKTLTASVDFYAKRQQLVAASAGADIGRIQRAARGLITEQEALQFAAAAMNTEFKLSQQQMEEVAKFMIVLRNQGNDLEQVQTKLTQAIVEGNSRALREFGVIVDGSTGKLKTQQAILEEITKQNAAFGESLDLAGDESLRMSVEIKDAFDRVKNAIGEATVAVVRFIDAWRAAPSGPEALKQRALASAGEYIAQTQARKIRNLTPEQRQAIQNFHRHVGGLALGLASRLGMLEGGALNPLEFEPDELKGGRRSGGRGRRRTPPPPPQLVGRLAPGAIEGAAAISPRFSAESGLLGGMGKGSDPFANPELFKTNAELVAGYFRDTRTEAERLADALSIVGDRLVAGFEAWGSGAKSFSQAMREFVTGAIADILLGEAKKHAALAVADTLLGNLPGAGAHAAAAAGLAAASGAVRSLGQGGGGGGTVGSASGGRLPGAAAGSFGVAGGAGGQRSELIMFSVLDDNPRRQRRQVQDTVDRAGREIGPGTRIVRA